MGLLRLVARVGCWRGGAIRLLEEWSPIRFRAVDRTRLTDPLALFFRGLDFIIRPNDAGRLLAV